MSEYWKSTPKYYCKHCQLYVRDTKFERQNHEATGKHQGAIKRFLRDLHRGHEREDREKQKAKDEVARLNGNAGSGGSTANGLGQNAKSAYGGQNVKIGLSPADRAKQIKQLAEMGVVVPEEYRREMAMTGEWETISQRVIHPDEEVSGTVKKEEGDSKEGIKTEDEEALNIGVKRRREDKDDEGRDGEEAIRRGGWGSSTKEWAGGEELDLEALMGKKTTEQGGTEQIPCSTDVHDVNAVENEANLQVESPLLKSEESSLTLLPRLEAIPGYGELLSVKQETDKLGTGIVFKKRKAKPAR